MLAIKVEAAQQRKEFWFDRCGTSEGIPIDTPAERNAGHRFAVVWPFVLQLAYRCRCIDWPAHRPPGQMAQQKCLEARALPNDRYLMLCGEVLRPQCSCSIRLGLVGIEQHEALPRWDAMPAEVLQPLDSEYDAR